MSHWHVEKDKTSIPWTAEELKLATDMRAEGKTHPEIAKAVGRSKKAVRNKLNKTSFTSEELVKRAQSAKLYRARSCTQNERRVHADGYSTVGSRPTEELIRERDERSALRPRDLTAAFFGDPLPGRSALERRA